MTTTDGLNTEQQLINHLGSDNVTGDLFHRHAKAHDASHYLLIPEIAVRAQTTEDISTLLRVCSSTKSSVTFRSGGTSLSGQASGAGVLVDTRSAFQNIEILEDGKILRVSPGVTLRMANARLRRYGRKLGPDPASEGACTIGGVIANNSSGMHCGTEFNTYNTIENMVFVLPTGTVVDTSRDDVHSWFAQKEPEIHEGLLRLRDRIRESSELVRKIEHQYSMKNTMGYGLNSFLDFDHPVDILMHLLVGSEGTLGFVARADFRTVEIPKKLSTSLLLFEDVGDAAIHVPDLVSSGVLTAELMDAASLNVVASLPSAPKEISGLTIQDHAGLLVEFGGENEEDLQDQLSTATTTLDALPLAQPWEFTTDPVTRAGLWHVRKGLYSIVAEARPSGTNQLLEDIAVPVASLGDTCQDLADMFQKHGYENSVIFGHAKDGNLHFMLTERFDKDLSRYEDFTEDLVESVLERGGTLKAEHGTGRVMAPYVRRQFGDDLYNVMTELKMLVDRGMVLNPGILLSDDPNSYLQNLKTAPTVEEEVDRCVECGYCEPACPSRDLTLTPRQRITLRRDLEAAKRAGNQEIVEAINNKWDYEGVQTCAVDGMCQIACPVQINTGDLVRRLRGEQSRPVERQAWNATAKAWNPLVTTASLGLTVASKIPDVLPKTATNFARKILGNDVVPQWDNSLPSGGTSRKEIQNDAADLVWFQSCINSMFGPDDSEDIGTAQAVKALAQRAGLRVRTPRNIVNLCCGTPWKSKGHHSGWEAMKAKVLPLLLESSDNGNLPVIVDSSSCAEGLRLYMEGHELESQVRIVDAVTYFGENLDKLDIKSKLDAVAVHPTCSGQSKPDMDALLAVADGIAEEVFVPIAAGCCGFAGDRGLLHPELTASATTPERDDIHDEEIRRGSLFDAYVSTNRTCEIGMSRATNRSYRNVLELLEEVTRTVQKR